MQFTAIQITTRDNTGSKLRATASVVLDNMIVINDIKILEKDESFFLAMPSRSTKAGTFKDVVHPISQDVRSAFETNIFGAYRKAIQSGFSKVEFLLKENNTATLLEQNSEMFFLGRTTSVEGFHHNYNKQPTPPDNKQHVDKNAQENDDLLKWLEG